LSAQRKEAKAVRAAEFKQTAKKVILNYDVRTSDDLVEDTRNMMGKIDVHIDIQQYRIVLASFVPIPCPCCRELRGLGEFNHYPCACGYMDIHGGRKRFFSKQTPSCVFCGTLRLKNGEFRSCVCIERAIAYLELKEGKQRYFLFVYLH